MSPHQHRRVAGERDRLAIRRPAARRPARSRHPAAKSCAASAFDLPRSHTARSWRQLAHLGVRLELRHLAVAPPALDQAAIGLASPRPEPSTAGRPGSSALRTSGRWKLGSRADRAGERRRTRNRHGARAAARRSAPGTASRPSRSARCGERVRPSSAPTIGTSSWSGGPAWVWRSTPVISNPPSAGCTPATSNLQARCSRHGHLIGEQAAEILPRYRLQRPAHVGERRLLAAGIPVELP